MISNHTEIKEFDLFEEKYSKILFSLYPHIEKYILHCFTFDDYKSLENVPILDFSDLDIFGFSFDDTNKKNDINAAIIISPSMCRELELENTEILAAIAHEIGHIIYLSCDRIKNMSGCWKEIYADKIATDIGLSKPMTSLLMKLKSSNYYSQEQNNCFDWRIKMLTNKVLD